MLRVQQVQFTAADKIHCENLVRTLVQIVLEDSRIVGYRKKQRTTAKWRSKVERIEVHECGAGPSNGRRLKQSSVECNLLLEFYLERSIAQFVIWDS